MGIASNWHFYFIFLKTLSSVYGSSATPAEAWFDEKDVVLGMTETETAKAISVRHCAIRCLLDVECQVYQYIAHAQQNCVLYRNTTQDGSPLTSNQHSQLYEKVIHEENEVDDGHNWSPPHEWNSDDFPVVYQSFDNNINSEFQLMSGAQLVAGKVNNAIKTDLDAQQWVSLGNLSGVACLAIPDSCGSEGGALSVWIKIEDCGLDGGIISSSHTASAGSGGIILRCRRDAIGLFVMLPTSTFSASTSLPTQWSHLVLNSLPTQWFHLVLNYLGPNQGATIYQNGEENVANQQSGSATQITGTGVVVIGRISTVLESRYTSVMIDELMFFNRKLTSDESQILYNQHK